jgi:hypothetical protein
MGLVGITSLMFSFFTFYFESRVIRNEVENGTNRMIKTN